MNPAFRKSRDNRNTDWAQLASHYGSAGKYCISYPVDGIPMVLSVRISPG
jgi:hypothetical protein